MTQGERVREIRKKLGLTLEEFGKAVGVQRSAISKIERGERSLTEQMAKSICRAHNVNYDYLVKGDGEPFSDTPQTTLDELCEQYKCDSLDRSIIQEYLDLDEADRQVIKEYIKKVAMKIATDDMTTLMPEEPDMFKDEELPEEAEPKKIAEQPPLKGAPSVTLYKLRPLKQ